MKILSNFKDYYDYLAYQYGIDNQIVFKRNRVIPLNEVRNFISLPESDFINDDAIIPEVYKFRCHSGLLNPFYYEEGHKIFQFENVSIVGTIYYYLYEYDPLKKSSLLRMPKLEDYIKYNKWREKMGCDGRGHIAWPEIWGGKNGWQHIRSRNIGIIQHDETRLAYGIPAELHKELQAPILWKRFRLPANTLCLLMPALSKISGFSGAYPPERIYRDIYNFWQEAQKSPDASPLETVDNKSKIVKHGFDLKKSFRHRVKSFSAKRKSN